MSSDMSIKMIQSRARCRLACSLPAYCVKLFTATLRTVWVTQVNRMSRSRRVLATGGKQRIFGLDMVCIETILFHLDSF